MFGKKEDLKIVIVGHVDHGKSTLIGRLLLDTESLPKDKIQEIKKVSKELGKDVELAYLTDQLKEEREQNITIDTTQIFFKTRKRNYVIIDAPGHVEFLKNMITGASQAEAAVLIVDLEEGIQEQTKRHAYIISLLGLKNLIVVFNKMDLINYDKARFDEVQTELSEFLQTLKLKPQFLIPISAAKGVNITRKSDQTSWYTGATLLKALDTLKVPSDISKKPLRFPVQDVYEQDGNQIVVGRLSSGTIEQSQTALLAASKEELHVKSILCFGEPKKTIASAEENIGLILKEATSIKRGDIITSKDSPAEPVTNFSGDIFWMVNEPLEKGKTVTLRCATQEVICTVEQIKNRMNSSTLEILEKDATQLNINETGVVVFKSETPLAIEKFSYLPELGRFVIEHNYDLQGAGIIT